MAGPAGCRHKRAQGSAVEPKYGSGLDRAEAKFRAGRTPSRVETGFGCDVASNYSSFAYGLRAGPEIGPLDRNAVDLAERPRRQTRIERRLEGRHAAVAIYRGVADDCFGLKQLGECTRRIQRSVSRPLISVYQMNEKFYRPSHRFRSVEHGRLSHDTH